MTYLIVGLGNLAVGIAYMSLGLLSAWEAYSQYRVRGLSRFGVGFSMMAASCGPHHLIHGWCVLQAGAVTTPMLAITLIGLPAGIAFCSLRAEAMLGGRGDRAVTASPQVMIALAVVLLMAVGSLAGWAVAAPMPALPEQIICTIGGIQVISSPRGGIDLASPVFLANTFVTLTYAMVGWYLIETQWRRYVTSRSYSLSGLSLAAIFPTCAAMHLVLALTSARGDATLVFDLIGVPASVYFLWIVRRLHTDSVVDWNRRPLVGVGAMPSRSAPWSDVTVSGR